MVRSTTQGCTRRARQRACPSLTWGTLAPRTQDGHSASAPWVRGSGARAGEACVGALSKQRISSLRNGGQDLSRSTERRQAASGDAKITKQDIRLLLPLLPSPPFLALPNLPDPPSPVCLIVDPGILPHTSFASYHTRPSPPCLTCLGSLRAPPFPSLPHLLGGPHAPPHPHLLPPFSPLPSNLLGQPARHVDAVRQL